MIIDLHVHTTLGSADSTIEPQELIEVALKMGLDGVCVTEHGNLKPQGLEELGEKHGLLVIGGMEASTELGDILIFGLEGYPRQIHRAADLRRYVLEAGGIMVAAHPFRFDFSPKPWLRTPPALAIEEACQWELFRLVDAMEVVNGWATERDVTFALEVSRKLGLKGTGGSDAHVPREIGLCATVFEDPIRGEGDLVRCLKEGRYRAQDRRPESLKNPLHLA